MSAEGRTCLGSSSPTARGDECQLLNHEPLAFPAPDTHVSPAETAAGSSRSRSGDDGLQAEEWLDWAGPQSKSTDRVPTDRRRLRGGELLHLLAFTSICSSVPPHIDAGPLLSPMLSHRRPPPTTPPAQNMSDRYPWIISNTAHVNLTCRCGRQGQRHCFMHVGSSAPLEDKA